jgi:antirestriction protein ArdC
METRLMLETYGLRLLTWLDEVAIPEFDAAFTGTARAIDHRLDDFAEYVTRWRELLEDAVADQAVAAAR